VVVDDVDALLEIEDRRRAWSALAGPGGALPGGLTVIASCQETRDVLDVLDVLDGNVTAAPVRQISLVELVPARA